MSNLNDAKQLILETELDGVIEEFELSAKAKSLISAGISFGIFTGLMKYIEYMVNAISSDSIRRHIGRIFDTHDTNIQQMLLNAESSISNVHYTITSNSLNAIETVRNFTNANNIDFASASHPEKMINAFEEVLSRIRNEVSPEQIKLAFNDFQKAAHELQQNSNLSSVSSNYLDKINGKLGEAIAKYSESSSGLKEEYERLITRKFELTAKLAEDENLRKELMDNISSNAEQSVSVYLLMFWSVTAVIFVLMLVNTLLTPDGQQSNAKKIVNNFKKLISKSTKSFMKAIK